MEIELLPWVPKIALEAASERECVKSKAVNKKHTIHPSNLQVLRFWHQQQEHPSGWVSDQLSPLPTVARLCPSATQPAITFTCQITPGGRRCL